MLDCSKACLPLTLPLDLAIGKFIRSRTTDEEKVKQQMDEVAGGVIVSTAP